MVPENIHTPTTEGHWKFQGGGGSQRPKFFKESISINWNFQSGGEFKPLLGGSMEIFWNNTIWQRNFSNGIKSGFIVPCAVLWDFCNSNDISTQNLWKCIKLGVQNFSKDSYKVKFENITG